MGKPWVNMEEQIMLPELPTRQKKRMISLEVDERLYIAASSEISKGKLKIREVVEWGLGAFLLIRNPKLAASLGIKEKTKK